MKAKRIRTERKMYIFQLLTKMHFFIDDITVTVIKMIIKLA